MIQTIELKLELKKFDRLANYVNFQVLCEIDFNLFFSNIIAFGNVKQKEYYRGLIDECLSFFESEEEYENCQKLFLLKQKTEHKEMLNYFISDPDNVNNLIVNDNTWFISYRTKPFEGYYDDNDFGYVYMSPQSKMTVMYVNKKTNKIYYGNMDYYIDLRNFENVDNPRFNRQFEFTEVFNDKNSPNMKETFMKYYPQILKSYFKVRKEFFHPHENDYMYMPPQYVQIGDKIGGRHNSDAVITNITKNNNGKFQFDVTDSSGRLSKNAYYNDDIGLGIRYDKEKHNPTHLKIL